MQHILMTADAVGGVWTYATDLARALGDRGIAVTIAVMGPEPSPDQYAACRNLRHVSVTWQPFRLEWMDDPWPDVARAAGWLLDLERQIRPDVIHLNGYSHAALPWQAPVVVVAHSCVLSWWAAIHGGPAPAAWHRYATAVGEGLANADLVVAPTAWMLDALARHYRSLPRTVVILNGRFPAGPDTPAPGATPRPMAAPKEPLVFSSGRAWDPAKNIAALCACASSIAWPIHVAGDTVDPHGRVVSLERVTALGRLPAREVAAWMRRAAVYALPARYEPFGLSILEAALAGCALVLGDIPSLREIWNEHALFVPPDDPGRLAAALNSLISDERLLRRIAIRAQARARELTADRMADAYCLAYERLVRVSA